MKKRTIGIVIVSVLLLMVLAIYFGYVNLDYMFKGDLRFVSITYYDNVESAQFIVDDEEKKKDLQEIFFNKITSSIGPVTSEGGNYRVVFNYEKVELEFDLNLSDSSTKKSYIKYGNRGLDYSLNENDAKFLRNFMELNSIE